MYDDILRKLKEDRKYTLLELANNDSLSLDKVKEELLFILKDEIMAMPFSDNIDAYKYIYKIFDYFNLPTTEEEKFRVLQVLDACKIKCEKRIRKAKNGKKIEKKTKVLDKIKTLIEDNMKEIKQSIIKNIDPVEKEKSLYDLFSYLIYDLKEYDYLKEYVKLLPYKVDLANKDGKSFIEDLLDKYVCEASLNNMVNIFFYEKCLKLFIDSLIANNSQKLIDILKTRLEEYRTEINSFNMELSDKQRVIFYINEITNYLDTKDYNINDLLTEANSLLDSIDQVDFKNSDKQLFLIYFNYLISSLTGGAHGMEVINNLNEFGMYISNSLIEKEYKNKIIELNTSVIKYVYKLNNKYKDIRYLDYKYSIDSKRIEELEKEIKNVVVDNDECLLDCTDKYIITIDSKKTKVYDDAISVDCYQDGTKLLGIYLADVISTVKRDSPIDEHAYRLGESVQIARRFIPMLTYDIADKLTLRENENRRAIGYFFLLDKDMNIIDYKVRKCMIRVTDNFDYQLANSYLTASRSTERIAKLKEMQSVSKSVLLKGAAGRNYKKIKEMVRSGSSSINQNINLADDMIVNYMVFLNSFIASFFKKHEIPFIYRNNILEFDQNIRSKIFSIAKYDYSYLDVINCMERVTLSSYYSTINRGHSGLGVNAYCHATNPLRKYSSLEIQRLTEKYMINGDMSVTPNESGRLKSLCEYLNLRTDLNKEYNNELMILNAKGKTLTK